MLLVGPTGVKLILMSDVIGGTDWTGQTYTFDDYAGAFLPTAARRRPRELTGRPTTARATRSRRRACRSRT